MLKYLMIIICLGMFVSCSQNDWIVMTHLDSNNFEKKLVYIKDSRTGICFVVLKTSNLNTFNDASITCVPCENIKSELFVK